jgi:asparagine synthase (glutamine-hydrolysing)
MCGIAGLVDLSGWPIEPSLLRAMADAIHYRGPDDEGYLFINQGTQRFEHYCGPASPGLIREQLPSIDAAVASGHWNIGLAHRRFSIIDLSPSGHQPLLSEDGSCCVVFNGEIYNYIELRAELEQAGAVFRSHSDTEVLIQAYRTWGTECFGRFNGFWAVALYDFRAGKLILSRDRLGKKPLYWTRIGSRLYFASEIKSLLTVPEVWNRRRVNEVAAWHWCVDGRRDLEDSTLFDGIESLAPASWTVVDESFPNNVRTFWEVPRERLRETDIGIPEAARRVREALDDAVRMRLRADVPLAIELSGGMDSSTIVALAAGHYPGQLTTYTVRFPDPLSDEEPFAREVAKLYNTDYRVLEPELGGFWSDIGAFTRLQEEPYHSPNMQTSQIIWSLMRAAGTKVALTGAAGDELFAGYARYYAKAQFENIVHGRVGQLVDNARHWTENRHSLAAIAKEFVGMLGLRSLVRDIKTAFPALDNQVIKNLRTPKRQYYAATLSTWLREEIVNTQIPYWLRSGEKNYMGMPFEARSPFLDYRVVDIATQLPTTYLVRHGWHKWILRKAMEDMLPANIVWRRAKMGFPYPYERFFATYRGIIDLVLREAHNPYINFGRHERLRTNWNALSFILWYEMFINDNHGLFARIETLARQSDPGCDYGFTPAFRSARSIPPPARESRTVLPT